MASALKILKLFNLKNGLFNNHFGPELENIGFKNYIIGSVMRKMGAKKKRYLAISR